MPDEFFAQWDQVRPVTRNLLDAIMADVWPRPAAVIDFGLDSQKHYEALYYPIRQHEITPLQLDDALGHGEKLTALTRASPSNPHKDVEFRTSWDVVKMRGRTTPAEPSSPLPTPSEIARNKNTPSPEPGNGQEQKKGKPHEREP